MTFVGGQSAQKSIFFPCNAIDILLRLAIVWRGPNHGFRAFERGHGPVLAPLGSAHAINQIVANGDLSTPDPSACGARTSRAA